MKDIEIVQWVKFHKEGLMQEVKNIAKECNTRMDFIRALKEKYKLSITDADVVANNFYQKD